MDGKVTDLHAYEPRPMIENERAALA
jgi:hypothetical protein